MQFKRSMRIWLFGVAFLITGSLIGASYHRMKASASKPPSKTTGTKTTAGAAEKISVGIQVLLGDKSTVVDLGSTSNLPVAILSNEKFDATTVDASSLNFAGAAALKEKTGRRKGLIRDRKDKGKDRTIFKVVRQDVNGDRREDLIAYFSTPYLRQLQEGKNEAILRGFTVSGAEIEGTAAVDARGVSVLRRTSSSGQGKPAGVAPQFCNPTAITIPQQGNASPFPSTITVTGATTSITDVVVTLNDVSHTFPDDLDMILVSPTNQVLILDSGGWDGTDAIAADITFSKTAGYIPSSAPMVTGTFKPVAYFPLTDFGAPAPALTPATPYAHTFNAFNGIDANGTWSLFIRDAVEGDSGEVTGGWCISFPTTTPGCNNQLFQGSLEQGDTTQTNRLFRETVAGLCDAPKPCPGLGDKGGSKLLDTYTVTNNSGASTCVTASVTGSCDGNVFLVAYQPTFDPAGDLCTNYLSDSGTSPPFSPSIGETQTMSFGLQAGQSVVLVVHEIDSGVGCASYGLLVEGDVCVAQQGCTLTCPANITQSNDPNQCGAVVNYPAPTTTGTCGTVTCSPASGSFFPVGTTTVTCTATAGPNCTFTVTVADTQPPSITCTQNVTGVAPPPAPGAPCAAPATSSTTFTTPTATDNCPGVTTVCVPPSGSPFPVGTTTVTCTATDASGNTATCSFSVTTFNALLQDNANPNATLLFNTGTGDYVFCCNGTTFTGRGTVTQRGCTYTLVHNAANRRVNGEIDFATARGNGSLQSPPGKTICTIADSNIRNNTAACGGLVAPAPAQ